MQKVENGAICPEIPTGDEAIKAPIHFQFVVVVTLATHQTAPEGKKVRKLLYKTKKGTEDGWWLRGNLMTDCKGRGKGKGHVCGPKSEHYGTWRSWPSQNAKVRARHFVSRWNLIAPRTQSLAPKSKSISWIFWPKNRILWEIGTCIGTFMIKNLTY